MEANPGTKTVTYPLTSVNSLPGEPARTGYYFSHWNTKPDGSGATFTDTTPVNIGLTVYAQWEFILTYIITFDKNHEDADGWIEPNPMNKLVTSPETNVDLLPTPPTRNHYTFIGWNTQRDGLGTTFTSATEVTESIIVYAKWQGETYRVTFEKTIRGEISGNRATADSGCVVYVINSGTFTMSGGQISGNTTDKGSGGGVYVGTGCTFTMSGGTIYGNKTSEIGGGGVYIDNTTFIKTGGIITGYADDPVNGNVVKNSSGVVLNNYGHAVYVYGSPEKRRETTAGSDVNLDSSVPGTAGG